MPTDPDALPRPHGRRLREYYRSAGWPYLDEIELDLLHRGLIERCIHDDGRETIRVTGAGVAAIAQTRDRNRAAFDPHESLVADLAHHVARDGRLVYRGLSLRGRVGDAWRGCRPDLYSIRFTTIEAYTEPVIHEVKVRRADLLGELRDSGKRAAYHALSSRFYYVMPAGLADLDEIPEDCGVLFRGEAGFVLGRASPRRPTRPGFAQWMALARRSAEFCDLSEDATGLLADAG